MSAPVPRTSSGNCSGAITLPSPDKMAGSAIAELSPRYTVVFDETCELCRRCRHWLSGQPTYVRLDFLAAGSFEAEQRYGNLPWHRIELMVIADDGQAWVGANAFVMCLWATCRWRSLSYSLYSPHFGPLVEWFFHSLSANRSTVSAMLKPHTCSPDGTCSR